MYLFILWGKENNNDKHEVGQNIEEAVGNLLPLKIRFKR